VVGVRMRNELAEILKSKANQQGVELSKYVLRLVEDDIGDDVKKPVLDRRQLSFA
jgi:predicted HicB family RNase H-like nuclease